MKHTINNLQISGTNFSAFININKLKLYQYLESITHSSSTFVPIVLVNIIDVKNTIRF